MKKTFNNQCERVLKYMRDFGQITSLDAVKDLGVMSLARRICDLKERGVAINTHLKKALIVTAKTRILLFMSLRRVEPMEKTVNVV